MAEITITIRADEDDLRAFVGPMHRPDFPGAEHRMRCAIAAALPAHRIVVKPGMVLRRKHAPRTRRTPDGPRMPDGYWNENLQGPPPQGDVLNVGIDPAPTERYLVTFVSATHITMGVVGCHVSYSLKTDGLDPDEWTVILDAEDA